MRKVVASAPLALMLAAAPLVSADTIVYDNTVNFLGFLVDGRDSEWGDGVTLAGADRIITRISVLIHATNGDYRADVRVRLFEGGDHGIDLPGAMLWESELFEQMSLFKGSNLYDFEIPNVTAPDSLTWTLQLADVGGVEGAVGARFMHPQTAGSSQDHVWSRDGAGSWTHWWSQFVYNDFGARIEAIPEPATLTMLGFGALGLACLRRRRRSAAIC